MGGAVVTRSGYIKNVCPGWLDAGPERFFPAWPETRTHQGIQAIKKLGPGAFFALLIMSEGALYLGKRRKGNQASRINGRFAHQLKGLKSMSDLKYKSFDDMPARMVFSPEEITNGTLSAYMEKAQELAPDSIEVIASDAEQPDGWGVMVSTVSETRDVTDESGTVTKKRIAFRQLVWPVPTIEALMSDPQGIAFVTGAVQKEMAHQIARPFRDATTPAAEAMREAPATIQDYATRRAAESQFKVFNEMAASAIAMLKEVAGNHPFIKRLSKAMLREVLESAGASKAMAPDLEEAGLWDKTLDTLIQTAEGAEMSSQVFHDWKAKRHEVETLDLGTIDLGALKLKAPVSESAETPEAATE